MHRGLHAYGLCSVFNIKPNKTRIKDVVPM